MRERQVLDYLRRYEVTCRGLFDVAGSYVPVAAIAGDDAPRSDVESVRRACKTLACAGLLELIRTGPSTPLLVRLSVEDGIDVSTGQRLAPLVLPWQ